MLKLYSARDSLEAHFLRGMLAEEGIDAVVQGEVLAVGRGDLPMTMQTLPSVWINDEDSQAAQVVLQRLLYPPAAHEQPWHCPKCDQSVEGQFTACWHCGTQRPAAGR